MPPSARGSHYYGNVLKFLSCSVDHEAKADKLYGDLVKGRKNFGALTCDRCGAYITVSIRGLEWETRVFSRGSGKER